MKTISASLIIAGVVWTLGILAIDVLEFEKTFRCDDCILLPYLRPDLEVLK